MVSSVTLSAIVPALGYLRVCVCVEVHFLADITVCVTSALVHTIKSLVLCVRVLKAEEIYTTTDDKRQESGIPFFPASGNAFISLRGEKENFLVRFLSCFSLLCK